MNKKILTFIFCGILAVGYVNAISKLIIHKRITYSFDKNNAFGVGSEVLVRDVRVLGRFALGKVTGKGKGGKYQVKIIGAKNSFPYRPGKVGKKIR